MTAPRRFLCAFLGAALLAVAAQAAVAAEVDPATEQAIRRGVGWLKQPSFAGATPGERSLAAYALLRAGEPPETSVIAAAIRDARSRVTSQGYVPAGTAIYTAAVDVMLLEAANPELYRREIEAIARYLMATQGANGAWDYQVNTGERGGDTSQTQYALLGLWAALRAGVDVPVKVWDEAARWHVRTQQPGGGFIYHPFEGGQMTHSMTAAGVGSLTLLRRMLYPHNRDVPRPAAPSVPTAPSGPPRKYRFLERIDTGEKGMPRPVAAARPSGSAPKTPLSEIDAAIEDGVKWLSTNYRIAGISNYPLYYLYGLERLGALGEIERIGDRDWYADGASLLRQTQARDGSWSGTTGPMAGTSFGILFLRRATADLVGGARPQRFGAGLLVGGRGLPGDLTQVQVQAGEVKVNRPASPLDDLLVALETAPEPKIEKAQAAIVEAVQLGDPEQLIGQTDRLLQLADDPRPEVRRTALWALGHSGSLRLAPRLIRALEDPDLDVNVEAYNALCTLSRRPLGVDLPASPVEGIADDAPAEARQKAVAHWRSEAVIRWRQWYLRVRPYEERDDLLEPRRGRE